MPGERVAAIPLLKPPEVDAKLLALGYRGQKHARRAASVMAYRHVRRLQRLFLQGLPASDIAAVDSMRRGVNPRVG